MASLMPWAQSNTPSVSSFATSQYTLNGTASDPLQPLRAMADRVGKEVEKFAKRLDHWHTHENESQKNKYHTTVKLVGKFKDLAEATVKDLKDQNRAMDEGDWSRSIHRRIKDVAPKPARSAGNLFGQSIMSSIEPATQSNSSNMQELRHWQAELATWELVLAMVSLYHPDPQINPEADKKSKLNKAGGTDRNAPGNEVWDRFIIADDLAREKKVVLEWLQRTARHAENDVDSILEQWGKISGKDTDTWTSGWLDTKTKIKNAKRMLGAEGPLDPDTIVQGSDANQPLTTRLDPDAPMRQTRAIEKSDEYYEHALWMVCYEMMRRGESWDKIAEWFRERNESWRGVSIGASGAPQTPGAPNMSGNDYGYLFRRVCVAAARGARFPYEGAVYALLAGDAKLVQTLSRSWDTHLYAAYNALLIARFDHHLLHVPQDDPRASLKVQKQFDFPNLVEQFGKWETATQTVMDLLQQDEVTSAEAKTPMKLIQTALITRTLDQLFQKVGIVIADSFRSDNRGFKIILNPQDYVDSAEESSLEIDETYRVFLHDPHALRVLVHVYIIFHEGLHSIRAESEAMAVAMDNCIAAYVEMLRLSKRMQTIPLYTAMMDPASRGPLALAQILPEIRNLDEQKRLVDIMGMFRVPVQAVLSKSCMIVMSQSGLVTDDDRSVPKNVITRYKLLSKWEGKDPDPYLWPGGHRIRTDLPGFDITDEEEAIVESLQWYDHSKETEDMFEVLRETLSIFLLNGRLGAAEMLVGDLSVEKLSHSKTLTHCKYAFDFTKPGSEEQDTELLTLHMRNELRNSGRDSMQPSDVPSAEQHYDLVMGWRHESQAYYELSNIVRLISLYRQWREGEEQLIKSRNNNTISTMKELLKDIKDLFPTILDLTDVDTSAEDHLTWSLYKAYVPDLVFTYLSVLQSGAFFTSRDVILPAMDLAVLLADDDKPWLQRVFSETKLMRELVQRLADVSLAMVQLGEFGDAKAKRQGKVVGNTTRKVGPKGESLRVWDLGRAGFEI